MSDFVAEFEQSNAGDVAARPETVEGKPMDASSLLLLALLHGADLGLTCDAMESAKSNIVVVHEHNPLVTSCARAALTEATGLALDMWIARQQTRHPRIVPLVLWAAVAVKIAVISHDVRHQP